MKLLQNKMVVGGACIAAAAVFSFVLLPGMYKSRGKTEIVVNASDKMKENAEEKM